MPRLPCLRYYVTHAVRYIAVNTTLVQNRIRQAYATDAAATIDDFRRFIDMHTPAHADAAAAYA